MDADEGREPDDQEATVGALASRRAFAPRCLSVDLEVGRRDLRIHKFAAVRGDSGEALVHDQGPLPQALRQLDRFAEGLSFLLGHNLIAFDLPYLAAAAPDLAILQLPAVDTLRLNPLAFPRNPYHHLVKHYQDGQLKRGRVNDPELDARLTLEVFGDQRTALLELRERDPRLLLAWHWLTTVGDSASGVNSFFSSVRRAMRPADPEAQAVIEAFLRQSGCHAQARQISDEAAEHSWALAYAMAWLSVAGGNSVMPPWVRHQFPQAGALVRRLRDTPCADPACSWCRERHDAHKELKRWFGFDGFRAQPADASGKPLQQAIVEAAMAGQHALGILPTGSGKSLCYQISALSRYDKTGALTVVISPLVALMADQVAGLEARGIPACAALNGLLSMPERADVLERVRLGDIGILIVSPEQLRNKAFRRVLDQREVGAWVLDEAHCLSKWGHDFRPDYRYVGRFIRERAGDATVAPVLCLTATARPDVMADIVAHFRDKVGIELQVFDGGANRTNLDFSVVPTTPGEKLADLAQVLETYLPAHQPGGAIVYCATRARTEAVAEFLGQKGMAAAFFHAGLQPESKKSVQQRFINGELRVIAATNAFGMGIDKPDVRLVVHADIPGSLENYLQEAGRAGRDRAQARCVLLYCTDDVERQFSMSARGRLNRREIQAILRALRRLNRQKRFKGEVVATPGEILTAADDEQFERDSATDDTRVRTALSWLEESRLLQREQNEVQVFPSSLRVPSLEVARKRIENKRPMTREYREQLLKLVEALSAADRDEGISTDELMAMSGLSPEGVRRALYDLEELGIASNDTAITAFVHVAVERSSRKRFEQTIELEKALIAALREHAPDLEVGDTAPLYLRQTTQHLKDQGHASALPEKVWRLLKSLASDGRGEGGGQGSIALRRPDSEVVRLTLQRAWGSLDKTARLRRSAAGCLLEHLLETLPKGTRGNDRLAETTIGRLLQALKSHTALAGQIKDAQKLMDRALLWLHEQEVIRLNKGLAVFRPAMTIRLEQEQRNFVSADFEPLKVHYEEQVLQVHVMAEYAQRALEAMAEALRLTLDYFRLAQDEFIRIWLPKRNRELMRQTTPASWHDIVETLNNPTQQQIVTDERERTNVLVLAGPGSGKTRVLVHRIAYLVRARRENPRGIIALAYNRHAAADIRRRLQALIGDDSRGVLIMTCHALAMRLVGASFAGAAMEDGNFREVLEQAVALLKGDDLSPDERDEQRERLLGGFRWILVDEYQDIDAEQYALISALAGRTLQDEDRRLSLFAVGDDDQNIYAFNGASVEFIRRFTDDYAAAPAYLVENYRSTAHIIQASNRVIEDAATRMKAEHPIVIDRARRKLPAGGAWEALDPVSRGCVQILPAGHSRLTQAVAVMAELQRLATLDDGWQWPQAAVISREWQYLQPIRSYCELHGIPVQMADEEPPPFWRLRETRQLVEWLRERTSRLVDHATIEEWLTQQPDGPWWTLIRQAIGEYALENGAAELPTDQCLEWLAEWGRAARRQQDGLLLLTAHRAKGLEFEHVAVLDGGWAHRGNRQDDADAPRRLYYVAMTRARSTLTLARFGETHPILDTLAQDAAFLKRRPASLPAPEPALARRYLRPTLKQVDIGFAGRWAPSNRIHQRIARLRPGDPIQPVQKDGHWLLLDGNGDIVGRLSSHFHWPPHRSFKRGQVLAVVTRSKQDTPEDYRDSLRCEHWEVVLPELVVRPTDHS